MYFRYDDGEASKAMLEAVPLLLQHRVDLDASDHEGRTALHYAALGVSLVDKGFKSLCTIFRHDITFP